MPKVNKASEWHGGSETALGCCCSAREPRGAVTMCVFRDGAEQLLDPLTAGSVRCEKQCQTETPRPGLNNTDTKNPMLFPGTLHYPKSGTGQNTGGGTY